VDGWDDPRLVSIAALRRRGFTPESIRMFVDLCGVSKANSIADYAMLEYCIREDLKLKAPRVMAILDPVKLIIDNYPEGKTEELTVANNLDNEALGSRKVPFSRELYIDREDFMEEPPKKYFRMFPGNEVRLMNAYFVTCTGCVRDENGKVVEVLCEYDPLSRGGDPADGRKVKGATIHWVDSENCVDAEVRLYSNLFTDPNPDGPDKNFLDAMNPESLTVLKNCKVETSMVDIAREFDTRENRTGTNAPTFQFMRVGFFCLDNKDSTADHLVFNRSVSLRDGFKK
jgi:glutaminyl-tRNA synthetase